MLQAFQWMRWVTTSLLSIWGLVEQLPNLLLVHIIHVLYWRMEPSNAGEQTFGDSQGIPTRMKEGE